jgi:hypothetical protein
MTSAAFATASLVLDTSATPSFQARVRAVAAQDASAINTSNAVTVATPDFASAAPKMPPTSPYPMSDTRSAAMSPASIGGRASSDASADAVLIPRDHSGRMRVRADPPAPALFSTTTGCARAGLVLDHDRLRPRLLHLQRTLAGENIG